jgi:hypothetical protein
MKKHINHFNISKQSIKRNIDFYSGQIDSRDERYPALMKVSELINLRTNYYSLNELEILFDWYVTSSDECAVDHPEDYNPLVVYQAEQKIDRYDNAMKMLKKLSAQEQLIENNQSC